MTSMDLPDYMGLLLTLNILMDSNRDPNPTWQTLNTHDNCRQTSLWTQNRILIRRMHIDHHRTITLTLITLF